MAIIDDLRCQYHTQICDKVIRWRTSSHGPSAPNMADSANLFSCKASRHLLSLLPYPVGTTPLKQQAVGRKFEEITKDFLDAALAHLEHIRPGPWTYSLQGTIAAFDQYRHLSELAGLIEGHKALKTALGNYLITPDIVIARYPVPDSKINQSEIVVDDPGLPHHTPLRARNNAIPLLHASISCKWTFRSDRSQNARTEGLNLVRNRKGHTPHIVVITAEPMPSRIASLALGTGDLDCVYHFALPELVQAVNATGESEAKELLEMMIDGRRLRDICDLPFDLAI